MDKGLIKIEELKQKIANLQKSKMPNNNKIADITKAYKMLMGDISKFEQNDIDLSEEKRKNLEAPIKRKQEKKELITKIMLAYMITTIIAFLVVFIGSAGTIAIPQCLLSSLVLLAPVCGIVIPMEFKNINKKYPITDNPKIEEEILSNSTRLKSAYSKKSELDNLLNNLREKNAKIEEEINKYYKEIDSIVSIRTKVIEEFCNNNPELDKKLDVAYDNAKVKEKVK